MKGHLSMRALPNFKKGKLCVRKNFIKKNLWKFSRAFRVKKMYPWTMSGPKNAIAQAVAKFK